MDIGFGEETFDFLGEGLFENFDDILDDNELMEMVDTSVAAAGHLTPPAAAAAAAAPPAFPSLAGGDGTRLTATSQENKICDEMNIPEDWFTNLLDDPNLNIDLPVVSATIDTAAADEYIIKDDSLFWSSSPVSVLNHGSSGGGESGISTSSSSSSNSINNETDIVSLPPVPPNAPVIPAIPARARTKRPRPATFSLRIRMAVPDTPPVEGGTFISEYCPTPMKKKKKKHQQKHCHPSASTSELVPVPARKCLHCGIQRTPQWRLGPMGPKTLCNACGVRYKSGRLFPEYRPAASPTFVPSVHSNSHKKVVEMRIKATEKETSTAAATTTKVSPAAKNCDLLLYIRNMD